jgi:hypothetical protein
MTPEQLAAKTAELKKVAETIGTAGSSDDAILTAMQKGIVDGLNTLADLFKGKGKPPMKEEPEEEGEEEPEEGEEEEEEKGDGSPGYQDMEMGAPSPSGEFVDGTQFMLDAMAHLHKADANVQILTKAVSKLTRTVTELRAENIAIRGAIADSALSNANVTIPLAKAVIDIRESMGQIPAASPTPRPRLGAGGSVVVAAAYIGGSKEAEKKALSKALGAQIIDSAHVALFHQTRQFAQDEADAKALRTQVEALVS